MMIRNISEAKAELSALIAEVAKGNEVILAKAGKPVARIVPYSGATSPRRPSSMAGEIWIAPDFGAPISGPIRGHPRACLGFPVRA